MRRLSKKEQELCERILEGDGHNNYLANILFSDLPDAKIYLDKEKPELQIVYTSDQGHKNSDLYERNPQIRRLILETVTLIKLLEQEGYIILFMSVTEEPNFPIGAAPDTITSNGVEQKIIKISSEIKDASIIKLWTEYSSKAIYVTEEFRVFCENGYIPRSDVQFNQSLRLTKQSLEQTNQSLKLTKQSLEQTNQNLELTKQSLDLAKRSYRVAIITLIVTILTTLVSIAISLAWR